MYWLLKTEPSTYSFNDLVKVKQTSWDGVTNALALKHIRTMAVGDEAIIYHSGKEKSAVGLAKIISPPRADPKQNNPKLVVVDLKPGKALTKPVTLEQMKIDKRFAGSVFLRIGRLSVVPLSAEQWQAILELGGA